MQVWHGFLLTENSLEKVAKTRDAVPSVKIDFSVKLHLFLS